MASLSYAVGLRNVKTLWDAIKCFCHFWQFLGYFHSVKLNWSGFSTLICTHIQTCIPNLQCRYYRPGWVGEKPNSRMIDTGKLFGQSELNFQRGPDWVWLRPYMTLENTFFNTWTNFRNRFRALFFWNVRNSLKLNADNWIHNKTEFETLFYIFL